MGVHFGGIIIAIVFIGSLHAGALLSADWLIRPENRRVLAFVTAASWALVGSTFVIGAIQSVDWISKINSLSALSRSVAVALCGAGALSYYIGLRRWQHFNARQNRAGRPTPLSSADSFKPELSPADNRSAAVYLRTAGLLAGGLGWRLRSGRCLLVAGYSRITLKGSVPSVLSRLCWLASCWLAHLAAVCGKSAIDR